MPKLEILELQTIYRLSVGEYFRVNTIVCVRWLLLLDAIRYRWNRYHVNENVLQGFIVWRMLLTPFEDEVAYNAIVDTQFRVWFNTKLKTFIFNELIIRV